MLPALFLAAWAVLAGGAMAADLSVSPVRVFLSGDEKTRVISVMNKSPGKVALQLAVYSWEQDRDGRDVYTETRDIVIFPRLVNLQRNAEQVIRVGALVSPGVKEKTYRVYLEEIPQPGEGPGKGTRLKTLLRLGVPIFMEPHAPLASGAIGDVRLSGGRLSFTVKNTGNVHFVVKGVRVEGKGVRGGVVFREEFAGWYLHAGRSKVYTLEVRGEECLKTLSLDIGVLTDRFSVNETLDVLPEMCAK